MMKIASLFHSRVFLAFAVATLVIFGGIQFIRPTLETAPAPRNPNIPAPVETILRNACFNCHSSETKLAWFDQIAPAYWLVTSHVRAGREHLNFPELGKQSAAGQKVALFEAVNAIQQRTMPPQSYLLVHREARITPEQLVVLKTYAASLEFHNASDTQSFNAADEQFEKWIAANTASRKVRLAPNGIEFPADYKHWKSISSSDRVDNNTMRVVLGNDVAIRAITTGEISPWPDGTTFAKVLWEKLVDASGAVHTGRFRQVDFMIKDGRKYADTKGWGFARWLGGELQPFGRDRAFADSCLGCHALMRGRDFVFTKPIKSLP